jgi:hypothetical protein
MVTSAIAALHLHLPILQTQKQGLGSAKYFSVEESSTDKKFEKHWHRELLLQLITLGQTHHTR